ncbi:hypothetical protein Salat_2939200 [Sesamum alatum]|uniref:Uncharacterized protein n=1 Tax=Sesamum alatum TaxID=300844 RepID=A0AAE1XJ37_9LAMI|nr:hypothetical protein Salat_2939200 [Sesamum alatum]
MNARLAEIARNLRRRNSQVAAIPPPANAEVIVAPVADQPSESSERQPAPIEIASETHTEPSAVVPQAPLPPLRLHLAVQRGWVTKSSCSGHRRIEQSKETKDKSSSKSSKRSSKRAERRAAKDAAEEEENTKHFKDLVTWWKQAREDLKTPSSRVAKMEGEKLSPDWAIFAHSSMLRTLVGQDSFELYKTCCLDRDQVLLAQTAHTWVEEHLAHVLMQASVFGNNLALKCSMCRNDKADAEKKIHELEQSLENAKTAEKEALEAKAAADARAIALET